MLEQPLELIKHHKSWQTLLLLYHSVQIQYAIVDESNTLLPRIAHAEGIPQEQLSHVHGQLIAHGFLKFSWIDNKQGLGYQLTSTAIKHCRSKEHR